MAQFKETNWDNWTEFSLENRTKYYKSLRRKDFEIPKSAKYQDYTKEEFFNALKELIIMKFNMDSRDLLQLKGGVDAVLYPLKDDLLWAFYNQMDYMIGNGTYISIDSNLSVNLGGNTITASSNSLGWNWEQNSYNIFIKYKLFDEYGSGQLPWSWKYGWCDFGINDEKIITKSELNIAIKNTEIKAEELVKTEATTRKEEDNKLLTKINTDTDNINKKIPIYLDQDDINLGQVNKIQLDKQEKNVMYATYQTESSGAGKLTIGVNNAEIPKGNIVNEWDGTASNVPSTKLVQDTLWVDGDPTKQINDKYIEPTATKVANNISSSNIDKLFLNDNRIEGIKYENLNFENYNQNIFNKINFKIVSKVEDLQDSRGKLILIQNIIDNYIFYTNGCEYFDIGTKQYNIIYKFNELYNFRLSGTFYSSVYCFIILEGQKIAYGRLDVDYSKNNFDFTEFSINNWKIYISEKKLDPYFFNISKINIQNNFLSQQKSDVKQNSDHRVETLKSMINQSKSRYELSELKEHPYYTDISKNDLKDTVDIAYNNKWKEL